MGIESTIPTLFISPMLIKLPWILLKYAVVLPLCLSILYFGFLQPASKRISLLDLEQGPREGFASFAEFGDFTAKYVTIYRVYYNIWLPEEAEIKGHKGE